MTVDPDLVPILARIKAAPAVDYRTMPMDEARAIFTAGNAAFNRAPPHVAEVTDLEIPGDDGPLRARLYRPSLAEDAPVVVYAHGGGWTFGSVDTHDGTMRRLALRSGAAVLGVDYRLAPEHPFPKPLDDVLAAIRFVENGGLGQSVDASRIAVSGDSAGANLALAALLARRDAGLPQLRTAALFYGCYAPDHGTASHARLGDGTYLLSTASMQWYWGNFLGALPRDTDSLAAPLRAPLKGLPPLYLNAAGLDPLLDDTLALSAALAEAGVSFRLDVVPGVVHGFLRMAAELPAADKALADAGAYLAGHFAR
ncbi:alpha/beta hydrolase [Chelatococcus asaccharovorans]|uniref:alpha/beta hydrolase n=1 Tax=Chelatococcus asaccharovorans TaxID=28210 RepID=UPI00224C6DF6|nr:alpha/beta hydrolase [Chelatococcus asaccharovorans]CAH1658842.1 Acetyl esterase [Chelatococcus asaccharovorans]CAH1684381.1 Acetyl esterase [Chelatococcus asaccharovorans]